MASKLSSIDYSKRAKGVSKREYAAQQLGGKLNYKTGQITVKKSTPVKKYSQAYTPSLSGDDADMGYIGTPEYQQYLNENNGKAMPDEIYQIKNAEFNSKRGKGISVPTKVNTSQRSLAATVADGKGIVAGTSTSKPKIVASNPTNVGKGLQWLNETLGYGYGKLTGAENPMLGLSQQVMGGDRGWTEKLQDVLGLPANAALREDYTSGGDYRNPQTVSAINPWEVGTEAENRARTQQIEAGNTNPTTNYGTGFTTGYNDTGRIGNDVIPGTNDNRRTSSRPVSNPTYTPAQSSLISTILGESNPQSAPDFSQAQTQNNTRRQFLGNGVLTTGEYGNGKGDYGVEGSLTGTSGIDEESLLNDLMNIFTVPKAEAATTDLFSQPNTSGFNFNSSALGQAINGNNQQTPGPWASGYIFPKNTSNEDITSVPPIDKKQSLGGSGSGGVVPQYSQQLQNPQIAQIEAALKGYKKLLNEQIKALKKQYKESERTGTEALNKQKTEDLNALGARFSFGLNQDPNSEQAVQYAQRTSNDYAGQLAEFLKKLSTAKTQDISSAKQNYYSQKSSAQEKLAQLMYQMQKDAQDRADKLSKGGTIKNGTYTIVPGKNGANQYMYNTGSALIPISESQYMAGKYGVGIGNYGGSSDGQEGDPNDPSTWTDEQIERGYF